MDQIFSALRVLNIIINSRSGEFSRIFKIVFCNRPRVRTRVDVVAARDAREQCREHRGRDEDARDTAGAARRPPLQLSRRHRERRRRQKTRTMRLRDAADVYL